MDVRPYQPSDRDACLALFDSNVPRFFAAVERGGFENFLDAPDCSYFVMEHEGAILGSGGYAMAHDGSASLTWGMVRADSQGMGLGRYLLMFRLREIGKAANVELVRLETSQHTAPFFEKQGFRVLSVAADGYAPGFDRVVMVKRLSVCA